LELSLGLCLSLTFLVAARPPHGAAEPPRASLPVSAPAAVSAPMQLGLAGCVQMALERHPKIAAERASLAAAQGVEHSLSRLRAPVLLVPELPIRRHQAALGTQSAAAALDQVQRDTVYAVTRTYVTVLFAREQERVARRVVDRLSATHEAAAGALKGQSRDVTSADVNRTQVYLRLARMRQIEAEEGVKRALAALKEAIGLGPDCHIEVPDEKLPTPTCAPARDTIIALALARRGEIVQVSTLAQVTALETDAQAKTHRRRMETFAASSDIHGREVPGTIRNKEYRPGGLPPSMPAMLPGRRCDRVSLAQSHAARAEAVVETTRNLVALEAEDAFLRWEESTRQAEEASAAVKAGDKLADDLDKDFRAMLKVRVEDVVNARVLAAQAQAQLNESKYRQILALADLERVTAGGFCAGLTGAAPASPVQQQLPEPQNEPGSARLPWRRPLGEAAVSGAPSEPRPVNAWATHR
jgi:outer membrane protein TolC